MKLNEVLDSDNKPNIRVLRDFNYGWFLVKKNGAVHSKHITQEAADREADKLRKKHGMRVRKHNYKQDS